MTIEERITIKGTSDGLIINIGAGSWPRLLEELASHLGQRASFFKGGRVALHVGSRQLTEPQIEMVGHLLTQHHMSLWAIESDEIATQSAATALGLEIGLTSKPLAEASANRSAQDNSIVIQRTLRSGQVISHSGTVVIIGDVNPGAEVKAGGSVIIWGRLRGTVHAGMGEAGDEAVVCALQLAPTQLRINSYITRSPANVSDNDDVVPEMASIQHGQIVAVAWPS